MRQITGILLLLALLLLCAAADDKEKEPDPTFRPGAEVSIELTVKAPRGWQLNYLLPIQAIFDEKQLKDAPYAPVSNTVSFKLKEYAEEAVLTIPVKLKKSARPGEVEVPFGLDYSICNIESEDCTFNVQSARVTADVETSAPAGTKNRALATGSLKAIVQLPPGAA
jgi:hypothetical protein